MLYSFVLFHFVKKLKKLEPKQEAHGLNCWLSINDKMKNSNPSNLTKSNTIQGRRVFYIRFTNTNEQIRLFLSYLNVNTCIYMYRFAIILYLLIWRHDIGINFNHPQREVKWYRLLSLKRLVFSQSPSVSWFNVIS